MFQTFHVISGDFSNPGSLYKYYSKTHLSYLVFNPIAISKGAQYTRGRPYLMCALGDTMSTRTDMITGITDMIVFFLLFLILLTMTNNGIQKVNSTF